MDARISLITLGVDDLDRAARFYEQLGWQRAAESQDEVAFFQLAGQVLALYSRADLSADLGIPVTGAGSVTLAQNFRGREGVDRAYAEAVSAGAKPLRTPYETGWGGYVAYIADPDGHVWEFAHNPAFPLGEDATLTLPSMTGLAR